MKEEKAVLTTEVNKQQKLLEKCNRGMWSQQVLCQFATSFAEASELYVVQRVCYRTVGQDTANNFKI